MRIDVDADNIAITNAGISNAVFSHWREVPGPFKTIGNKFLREFGEIYPNLLSIERFVANAADSDIPKSLKSNISVHFPKGFDEEGLKAVQIMNDEMTKKSFDLLISAKKQQLNSLTARVEAIPNDFAKEVKDLVNLTKDFVIDQVALCSIFHNECQRRKLNAVFAFKIKIEKQEARAKRLEDMALAANDLSVAELINKAVNDKVGAILDQKIKSLGLSNTNKKKKKNNKQKTNQKPKNDDAQGGSAPKNGAERKSGKGRRGNAKKNRPKKH